MWQKRYDEECERLRQETIRVQTELDIQLRSLSERLEVATAQQGESLQVIVCRFPLLDRRRSFVRIRNGLIFKQNLLRRSTNYQRS